MSQTQVGTPRPAAARDETHGWPVHRAGAATRVSLSEVRGRRLLGLLLVVVPLAWALARAIPEGRAIVNTGGLALLDDLAAGVLRPSLAPDFLSLVLDAAVVTLVFAALGTAGALAVGVVGGLVLSDVAWARQPPAGVRALRSLVRGLLVAVRAVHELVWALLFVSVLGLDPLVAVLAIAVPFGAQTAKVFAEIVDGVDPAALRLIRNSGARRSTTLVYGLLPAATPLLLSYSFYRFECAIRSAVLLGVVGVGGLGQELVVSLQSRNWAEVWTLVAAVLVLSAAADVWSSKVRGELPGATRDDEATEAECGRSVATAPARTGSGRGWWGRASALLLVPVLVAAWFASDVSWAGLASPRTRELTLGLLDDLWPPALPPGGWSVLVGGVLDTLAMAVLAMAVAVVVTLVVGPWATRPDLARPRTVRAMARHLIRVVARLLLLVLRSVPPTIWAIVALLALFPGILPGALALGLYTGGILGRLVAEAWESLDRRPTWALRNAGVGGRMAAVTAQTAPSSQQLVAYTLYRFEICVRDTAVVGVVGAAGLGRLFAENLAVFRFPVVATLLLASVAVSLAAELVGRRLRRALRGTPPEARGRFRPARQPAISAASARSSSSAR